MSKLKISSAHFISLFFITFLSGLFSTTTDAATSDSLVTLKILGINDFHGQISQGRRVNNHLVGGAAVLAAYLHAAEQGREDHTLITLVGDLIGASPPASALLADEPTILFFNQLGNAHCSTRLRYDPHCNLVATIGNHEFDKGLQEMLRLIYGGSTSDIPLFISHYPGATFPYVSANIIDAKTKKLIFPPYIIKEIQGIKIGFIGAILKNAPSVILPSSTVGVSFLDEAQSINHYIPEIKAQGANIIIVLIHQGGYEIPPYTGPTQNHAKVRGPIVNIVKQLDHAVDIVLSGHTHEFTNSYITNRDGKEILLTQANSYSTHFAEITLVFNRKTRFLEKKSARIITTFADSGPGLQPNPAAQALVTKAEQTVAPLTHRYIATLSDNLFKKSNEAGESALGNLIADATRYAVHADIGLVNPGSIRADLDAGPITWGTLYAVLPFHNNIVKMQLKGSVIYAILNQQWLNQPKPRLLQISGFSYQWDPRKPIGDRVANVLYRQKPLQKNARYIVATNNFLATGGDNFIAMKQGKILETGPIDLDALIHYIQQLPQPFTGKVEGRIQIIH